MIKVPDTIHVRLDMENFESEVVVGNCKGVSGSNAIQHLETKISFLWGRYRLKYPFQIH